MVGKGTVEQVFEVRSQNYEKRLLVSCLSVSPSAWNSAPIGRIFTKFGIWALFENLSRKFRCHQNVTSITGALHEAPCTFMIISRSILLRMRNISDKLVQKMKTHILYSVNFSGNCAVCDIMWKNVVRTDRQATNDNTTRRVQFACWITWSQKHTLRVCNTYRFSTAIQVTRRRLHVTLYVHRLSWFDVLGFSPDFITPPILHTHISFIYNRHYVIATPDSVLK
jgi:hypothetical protein